MFHKVPSPKFISFIHIIQVPLGIFQRLYTNKLSYNTYIIALLFHTYIQGNPVEELQIKSLTNMSTIRNSYSSKIKHETLPLHYFGPMYGGL